jgi:CheY-like chemotaxis protein
MKKILVIEDTPEYRIVVKHILSKKQFQVSEAENGTDGIAIALRELPELIVCDIGLPDMTGFEILERLLKEPSMVNTKFIFLTALDFAMAEKALRQGLTVCIYDPLTWYWKTIPAVVSKVDLYIAQNFFGVEERLKSAEFANATWQTVAPIVGSKSKEQADNKPENGSAKDLVLVNLGGLSNPLWTGNEALSYASQILEAVLPTLAGQKVVVAANSAISAALAHLGAQNLSREQMQVVLKQAKYALMTPGLGNIYDAARFNTPTIWLPPANDSQGQQLALLNQSSLMDGLVDWHQILPISVIDYSADQGAVLKSIAAALEQDGFARCIADGNPRAGGALQIGEV